MTEWRDKYYTAFVYGRELLKKGGVPDLSLGHVTHKYLGELGQEKLSMVWMIVNDYFLDDNRLFPRAVFDGPTLFAGRTPVLVAKRGYVLGEWFMDLRRQLDQFRKDDYPEYTPHVSTRDREPITRSFFGYAIVNSTRKKIHYCWKNPVCG